MLSAINWVLCLFVCSAAAHFHATIDKNVRGINVCVCVHDALHKTVNVNSAIVQMSTKYIVKPLLDTCKIWISHFMQRMADDSDIIKE